ncbi:MsnO8 family LLM class oxidoreductase [Actinomyces marmotae]|uniref:MsnO8 family LLM class oxidoreductase n=2 Tax=Actinomycetaceae TaxID=2049 RepID=A0A6M8B124_9ACTO|nr:MsnO8 family LLM class oxidoreductase [Actinomyces marmotae]
MSRPGHYRSAMSAELSVLDPVPSAVGRGWGRALTEMRELARAADRAGYARYWVTEYHASPLYLSSATPILLGQVLAATERIGVAGCSMLPNHPPLVVAEQFGTLATIYPGRVGIGLGRAPGTDALTAGALRRGPADPAAFTSSITDILGYVGHGEPGGPGSRVRAVPGEGTRTPVWVLGSSVNGARVAGALGLPFVVASHFAPSQAEAAVATYRSVFDASAPTATIEAPRVAAAVNAAVAPSDDEARSLFSTAMACAARLVSGAPGPLEPPLEDPEGWRALAAGREGAVEEAMRLSFVGAPETVVTGLRDLEERWGLEEVLVLSYIYDAAARRRSYELLASAWRP